MLLDDALGVGWSHVPVPCALGINHAYRTVDADAQTVAFRAVSGPVGTGKVQLLQALLKMLPRRLPLGSIATIGTEADQQVPGEFPHTESGGDLVRR